MGRRFRGFKLKSGLGVLGILALLTNVALANDVFDLSGLEPGKHVTLPSRITTAVPLGQEVRLKANEKHQTLLFSVPRGSGQKSILVTIFDKAKPKEIVVRKGQAAMYSFQGMSQIRLIPGRLEKKIPAKLLIESNKPLSIAW